MFSSGGIGARRSLVRAAAALALAWPASALAHVTPLSETSSALALPLPPADPMARLADAAPAGGAVAAPASHTHVVPNVLRSLALPGWGALAAGHRNVGLSFLVAEAALWTTVGVSVGQGRLRRGSSEQSAEIYADFDLKAHDDRFRKLLSNYRSSDEYNRLVIYREAAALYYGDVTRYNDYIDTHSLKGADAWNWQSDEQWERYRQLRRASERAFQRARFAAAGALVNRVAAAIVSSRLSPSSGTATRAAGDEGVALGHWEWSVEQPGKSPLALKHRLAWVLRFE